MSVTGHDPPPPRTLSEEEPVVVVVDGQRFAFRPGSALERMVRFLVMHAPIVGATKYSTWVFDVNEDDVKARVELRWATLCRPASEPG